MRGNHCSRSETQSREQGKPKRVTPKKQGGGAGGGGFAEVPLMAHYVAPKVRLGSRVLVLLGAGKRAVS